MKTLIIGLLLLNILITPVFAITPEQLTQAEDILRQMGGKISVLRGYVQTAQQGQIGFIVLTPEQIQQLKDRYLTEKGELVNLYNQLP